VSVCEHGGAYNHDAALAAPPIADMLASACIVWRADTSTPAGRAATARYSLQPPAIVVINPETREVVGRRQGRADPHELAIDLTGWMDAFPFQHAAAVDDGHMVRLAAACVCLAACATHKRTDPDISK
jgi:hypothetical protein